MKRCEVSGLFAVFGLSLLSPLMMGQGCIAQVDPGDNGGSDPSTRLTATISGAVQVGSHLALDGDTRDSNNTFTSNDSITPDGAQTVPAPCTIGGFLGRTRGKIDTRDVYRVQMAAGQTATLLLADPEANDFDLFLYDEMGDNTLDSSEGVGKAEQVLAPTNGTFLLEVLGYSVIHGRDPGGLYSLLVGDSTAAAADKAIWRDRLSSLHPYVEGEALVRYAARSESKRVALQKSLGFEVISEAQQAGGFHRLRLTAAAAETYKAATSDSTASSDTSSPVSSTIAAIKALRRQSDVECAQPNYIRRAAAVPDDIFYDQQWNLPFIELPAAWDITTGSSTVTVAVIDTGVALAHPDLAGQLISGYDFIADSDTALDGNGIDSDPTDPGDSPGFGVSSSFHGTHVAGTIAARTNNGAGVASVAWNIRIMPLRVLGRNGEGEDHDIAQAVRYAAGLSNDSGSLPARRADIINMSLGGPGSSDVLENAISAARQAGVIIVTAAGNDAGNADDYFPGAFEDVINVSAVDQSRTLAPYSNYGSSVVVTAPGGNLYTDYDGDGYHDGILSTLENDEGRYTYGFYEGTSMAAPHVSGVLALMKSIDPDLTPLDVDRLLAGTYPGTSLSIVDDLGSAGRDRYYGYGLISALKAVRAASVISGSSSSDTPVLRVVPQDLSFGTSLESATVTASNSYGGTLQISSITPNESWISVNPTSGGEGEYTINVTRSELPDGVYSTTIKFASNGGDVAVNVRMNVGVPNAGGGDVGTLYVLLVDPDTLETIAQTETTADRQYQFSFDGVPQGEYLLTAGTDMNDDLYIDDEGEAFGEYPVSSQPQLLNITGDLTGLSFSVTYLMNVQKPKAAGQLSGDSPVSTPRFHRLATKTVQQ